MTGSGNFFGVKFDFLVGRCVKKCKKVILLGRKSTICVSMLQLLGEYDCRVDSKGRMRLPTALLDQLQQLGADEFVINRGFEKYLTLYPKSIWEGITRDINRLNVYDKQHREFLRYFFRGAQPVVLDSAGRILVNKRLLDYAGIAKDVILSAVNDRIEIWDKAEYERQLEQEPEDFSDIAQAVMGNRPLGQVTDDTEP